MLDPLEMKALTIISYHMGLIIGIEPVFSRRAANALNCQAISPALISNI